MSILDSRLTKLEQRTGEPDEMRIRNMSDDELEADLDRLLAIVTDELVQAGRPVPQTDAEWLALCKADAVENNQRKSA